MKELIYQIIIRFFNSLFPIRKNKVLFISYYGNQYGCNPKYLSQYMVQQNRKWDIVWAFVRPKDYHIKGIRKVRYMSLAYFYELCTSKVIVSNYRMTSLFRKRKKQLYIQTWHSSLRLKMIEQDAEHTLPPHYVQLAKVDSQNIDFLLSGCQYSTSIFKRCFWYNGAIVATGTPRNDLLFKDNQKLKENILLKIGLSTTTKVALYAPTFRKGETLEYYNICYDDLIHTLEQRFGGTWCIAVRLHPHLRNLSEELRKNESSFIDVTLFDDIQELLFASDLLITDYSSLMFDFAITHRPCLLYVPDLKEYTSKDRSLYFSIEELPFLICKTREQLVEKINNFDTTSYTKKVSGFLRSIGSYETGNASKKVINLISQNIHS
ncbi:CDP-glycerol glycerophosphotransferase family protein [Phocaeicola sartorii]|uniref:CDP-glycerol glycerophosphotransferase family protein n=2 Tax=Phocaeicola sartorii TaxID=671267 RepID=UPI0013638997|nr:CDP-glycerol glycerophosphotransferase family protein [Phocaeicola sartorii]NBH67399.1 glycerophosphotransferase [Phocaeicola sartorii]